MFQKTQIYQPVSLNSWKRIVLLSLVFSVLSETKAISISKAQFLAKVKAMQCPLNAL